MGCAGSRLEESEVVALCRNRARDLAAAGDYRYALADAHSSYIHSLRSVGVSLHRFFLTTDSDPPPSLLTLPTRRKGDLVSPPPPPSSSGSDSGSHLKFHSSDDDDDDDDEDSPFHHLHPIDQSATTKTDTYLNFAKKDAPISTVTYEHRSFGANKDSSMSQNPNYDAGEGGAPSASYGYPPPHAHPPTCGGFFESSLPPPPPPQSSSWDFFNPFQYYQIHQQEFTLSQSSRDLREEEGIPDLEDEEHEVVKERYDVEKFAATTSSLKGNGGDLPSLGKDDMVGDDERSIGREKELQYQARKSDVCFTDKNVVADEVLQRQSDRGRQRKVIPGSRSVPDVLHEIYVNFEKASVSCEEIGRMLEVGKLPYHKRKYNVVSSKMRYAITLSISTALTSKMRYDNSDNGGSIHLDLVEEKGMKSGNLSSTLQKLYIWEKKLYEEVRAVEVMQLCLDKKCKMLKHLYDKGAEAPKVDSTRDAVMKLSTEIRIAIQVVDSISNRINKLRDEELWPELHELIQGLVKMWQVVTECHRSQFQAVTESNNLDAIAYAFAGKLDDEHMKVTMQLALDLLKWIEIFSFWIDTQKSYVRSLNGWLMKCLPNNQEETVDELAPFSPGRLGAPLVFVICNDWLHAIARISEQEVLEAIHLFTSNVMQVWNQHYKARLDSMKANQDNDRQLKALEKEDQKFWKAVDAINKRRVRVASQSIIMHMYPDRADTKPSCLQEGLRNIFEALERFSENYARVYEELCARCNEESKSGYERAK